MPIDTKALSNNHAKLVSACMLFKDPLKRRSGMGLNADKNADVLKIVSTQRKMATKILFINSEKSLRFLTRPSSNFSGLI